MRPGRKENIEHRTLNTEPQNVEGNARTSTFDIRYSLLDIRHSFLRWIPTLAHMRDPPPAGGVRTPHSLPTRTSRGLAPREGPTTPSCSIRSTIRAARLYPILSRRWIMEIEACRVSATSATAWS